jgi:hypothetical protein
MIIPTISRTIRIPTGYLFTSKCSKGELETPQE